MYSAGCFKFDSSNADEEPVNTKIDLPIACDEKSGLLAEDPAFYREILYHMSDGVYFVDRERRILYWNAGARNLTGYEPSEMIGRLCYDNILAHVDDCGSPLCENRCPLSAAIRDGRGYDASVFLRHKQGHRLPVAVRVQPIRGRDGNIEGAVEIFSNNSAQVSAERRLGELNRLAFVDHLTKLPNRRYLETALESAYREFKAEGARFGLMVVDVDRFKEINDTFGHGCGDSALQQIGKTLAFCIRSGDVLGRWGGDEFVGIIRGIDADGLRVIAERSLALVGKTEILGEEGAGIPVSISVGAALIGEVESPEELFRRADKLLYASKSSGRGRATFE